LASFGVQLAHLLIVLLAAACVLLGLLALVVHVRERQARRRVILQPIELCRVVRRGIGQSLSADALPLPARDPPDFPPLSNRAAARLRNRL
jgi:hypothetical protein